MFNCGIRRRIVSAAAVLVCLAALAQFAQAQTTIGVGNPGPVVPQQGLLGTYYNNTGNGAANIGPPPPPPPGSPITSPANAGLSVQFLQRIDATVDYDFQTTPPPGVNNVPGTADHYCVVWEGFIIATVAGTYTMATATDDGERAWYIDLTTMTPPINQWVQQGETQVTTSVAGITAGQRIPFRFEMYEHEGGSSARVRWQPPGAGAIVTIPAANLAPPDGPNAPGGFTVTATPNSQVAQVALSWNASTVPVAATSYILSRATAAGGPYTQIAVQAGTTYTDNAVAFGTTYFYRVQGTANLGLLVGPATAATPATGVTPVLPAITYSPSGPIVTSEGGLNATITLRVNASPAGSDFTFQMASSDTTEANLSGGGQPQGSPITITIPIGTAVGTTIPITVHGLDDSVADGTQPYNITFGSFAGGGAAFAGLSLPPIAGTNADNDTPNIIVTPISGATSENLTTATFSVTFATQPTATTTMSVVSSDTTEGTVSTGTLTFSAANWNVPHVVTVTGVDDAILDFAQAYTINLTVNAGGDLTYFNMTAAPNGPRQVSVINLDNEAIPGLPHVWGCGLLGAEIFLPLGLLSLLRRRRRNG